MGIYSIKPKFQLALQPLTSFLIRRQVNPDVLNWAGFGFAFLAAVSLFFSESNPFLLLLVLPLVGLRLTVNALDGQVSRGLHLASAWGEVKNEVFDRISDAMIFLALGVSGEGLLWPASLVVTLMLIHSFSGVLAKAIGQARNYAGIMGKADRMLWLGLGSVGVFMFQNHGLFVPLLWLVFAGLVISIIQKLLDIHAHI
jgi:phosphatidylglycerophosphate synthase